MNGPVVVALDWSLKQPGFSSPSFPALDYVLQSSNPPQVLLQAPVVPGPMTGLCAVAPGGSASVYVYVNGSQQVLTLANGTVLTTTTTNTNININTDDLLADGGWYP